MADTNRPMEAINTDRPVRMVSNETSREIDDALLNVIAETLRATAFEIKRTSSIPAELALADEINTAAYLIDPPLENRIKSFLKENACDMPNDAVSRVSSFLAKMLGREILQSAENKGKP